MSGTINAAYGERCYNSQLGSALFDAKRFGQKSGQGYYAYAQGKPKPDATLRPFLDASRAAASSSNIKPAVDGSKLSNDELVEAVLFPVVNESLRIIDEGFARNEAEVDVVSAMGQWRDPSEHAARVNSWWARDSHGLVWMMLFLFVCRLWFPRVARRCAALGREPPQGRIQVRGLASGADEQAVGTELQARRKVLRAMRTAAEEGGAVKR